MNVRLLVVGKNQGDNLDSWLDDYVKRLNHYCNFSLTFIEPKIKKTKLDSGGLKALEGRHILDQISDSSFFILLDERGKEYSSIQFSQFIQKRLNAAPKEIVFCIGGAYGFSDEVYSRANAKLALSQMTLTHQMVRLLAVEQIYRAFTILKGEKYHH